MQLLCGNKTCQYNMELNNLYDVANLPQHYADMSVAPIVVTASETITSPCWVNSSS